MGGPLQVNCRLSHDCKPGETRSGGRLTASVDHRSMASDQHLPVRPAREPARHDATRIVALRHAQRGRPRPEPANRLLRILAGAVVVIGVGAGFLVFMAIVSLSAAIGVLSVDLPDPSRLESLTFAQPTVVYDRTGTVELGRFQREERRVVAFDEVPRLVLDATTTAEDRTFWNNSGFDVPAIISAAAEGASGDPRTRRVDDHPAARPRPAAAGLGHQPGSDRYLRKAKELIQAMRLSETFPGEVGKERIITAYLNEIFYGHGAYGIAAAASIYFGVHDLAKLTPAQAALLAGLPKSPIDPRSVPRRQARQERPAGRADSDAPSVVRRDWILHGLADGGARWTSLTPSELRRPSTSRSSSPATSPTRSRRRISRGRSAASSSRSSATPKRSRPAATRSSRRSTGGPSRWPRSGWPPARSPRTCRSRAGDGLLKSLKIAEGRPRLGPRPARQGPPRRRPGRARLQDRRRPRLRRQRRLRPRLA